MLENLRTTYFDVDLYVRYKVSAPPTSVVGIGLCAAIRVLINSALTGLLLSYSTAAFGRLCQIPSGHYHCQWQVR